MSREKKIILRNFIGAVLAAGLFVAGVQSHAGAQHLPDYAHANDPTDPATNTPTEPPVETFTPTPTAPAHLVISEFRTRGRLGIGDEFVELYNPSGGVFNIGGWTIRKSYDCANTSTTLVTIKSGFLLQPGQHYLTAAYDSNIPDGSSITDADQTFLPGIDDTGGLALLSSGGTVIDQVGMCASTLYREGTNLPPLTGTSDQSYERKPGGDSSCYDTNNNASDFAIRETAKPQNSSVAAVLCSGVSRYTPTRTPTQTSTRTPTPRPTAIPGLVVLNEFLPHPRSDWNSDGSSNVEDEYIEIINLGLDPISVKNWRLDTGIGSKYFLLPDVTLEPRQITAFFRSQTGIPLSDGGSTVRLLKSDGYIADAYTYPVVEASDVNWCRLPDGTGVWGFACRPTPDRPNALIDFATPVVQSGAVAALPGICTHLNSIPPEMLLPECGSFGGQITNNLVEKIFWLPGNLKWEVFVQ